MSCQRKFEKGDIDNLLDVYEHLSISACVYVFIYSGCVADHVFKIIPVYRMESPCSIKSILYWPVLWSCDDNLLI